MTIWSKARNVATFVVKAVAIYIACVTTALAEIIPLVTIAVS